MVARHGRPPRASRFDINPTSRQMLQNLIELGLPAAADRRRAPASTRPAATAASAWARRRPPGDQPAHRAAQLSRTLRHEGGQRSTCAAPRRPRPRRSPAGSPIRAISRDLNLSYPRDIPDEDVLVSTEWLVPPPPPEESAKVELRKGPNIVSLPDMPPLPDELSLNVLIKLDDDVSTDEIMPAGNAVLPFRSNVPEIAKFVFGPVDETFLRPGDRGARQWWWGRRGGA
jgi:aconitate hydratase